jgi:hypothetical protein
MGILGVDANKVQQSTEQYQVTSQYGAALGAVKGTGTIGASGAGNITGGIKAGTGSSVSILSSDPQAIAAVSDIAHANMALSLEAMKQNQDLSTLAVSYAGQNANTALQTLQQLQTQSQVAQAGGSASDIAGVTGAYTGTSATPASNTGKYLMIVGGIALGLFAVYYFTKH